MPRVNYDLRRRPDDYRQEIYLLVTENVHIALGILTELASRAPGTESKKGQNMSWRQLACAVAMSIAVTASGISYADDDKDKHDGIDPSRVQQGFDASPIPKDKLNFKGKDPYLVGLGAYLVNAAADCSGCHSFPRFLAVNGQTRHHPSIRRSRTRTLRQRVPPQSLTGQLKANFNVNLAHNVDHYLAGGRCFGPIMARNITPDPNHSNRPSGPHRNAIYRGDADRQGRFLQQTESA